MKMAPKRKHKTGPPRGTFSNNPKESEKTQAIEIWEEAKSDYELQKNQTGADETDSDSTDEDEIVFEARTPASRHRSRPPHSPKTPSPLSQVTTPEPDEPNTKSHGQFTRRTGFLAEIDAWAGAALLRTARLVLTKRMKTKLKALAIADRCDPDSGELLPVEPQESGSYKRVMARLARSTSNQSDSDTDSVMSQDSVFPSETPKPKRSGNPTWRKKFREERIAYFCQAVATRQEQHGDWARWDGLPFLVVPKDSPYKRYHKYVGRMCALEVTDGGPGATVCKAPGEFQQSSLRKEFK